MKVTILKRGSANIIWASQFYGALYVMDKQKCVEEAWKHAVEDGDVESDKRDEYEFIVSDD